MRSTPACASADSGVAPLVWPTRGAAAATVSAAAAISAIGHAEQDRVAARGTLAAAERPLDLHAGVAKRPRERGADPPGADDAHPKWAVEAGL